MSYQQILVSRPGVPGMRWRSAFRGGALVIGGYAIVATVGMVALRIYTELAPAAVFGRANLLLTVLTLGMQLFVAPFTNTQLRYHTEAQAEGTANLFTRDALVWALRGAAALATLAFVGCLLCERFGGPSLGVIVAGAAVLWVFATAVRNVLLGRLQAERRRLAYSGLTVFEALAIAALTGAALKVAATTETFLLGQAAGLVALVIAYVVLIPWPKPTPGPAIPQRTQFRQKAVAYGVAFVPLAAVGWLANLADRYVLGLQLGAAAVGQYIAPLSIASRGMILANGALNDLFRPILFDAENRKDLAKANQVFFYWIAVNVCVGFAAVLVVATIGQTVVDVLLAKGYRDGAVRIMLWIASGYAAYGITQVLETRILSLGRSAQLVAPMAAGALANIGFSMLLVARHGILGAAQASCVSFLVQGVVTGLFLRAALLRRRSQLG